MALVVLRRRRGAGGENMRPADEAPLRRQRAQADEFRPPRRDQRRPRRRDLADTVLARRHHPPEPEIAQRWCGRASSAWVRRPFSMRSTFSASSP